MQTSDWIAVAGLALTVVGALVGALVGIINALLGRLVDHLDQRLDALEANQQAQDRSLTALHQHVALLAPAPPTPAPPPLRHRQSSVRGGECQESCRPI